MTPEQFKHWRDTMGFTLRDAAEALGYSLDTIKSYSSGRQEIPLVVALACSALYHRHGPWK